MTISPTAQCLKRLVEEITKLKQLSKLSKSPPSSAAQLLHSLNKIHGEMLGFLCVRDPLIDPYNRIHCTQGLK